MENTFVYPYPSDLVHGLLAAHCSDIRDYAIGKSLMKEEGPVNYLPGNLLVKFFIENNKVDLNLLLVDWKILKIFDHEKSDYLGAIYINSKAKQLVLVHRSTNFATAFKDDFFSKSSLQADVESVLMGHIVEHQVHGYMATHEAIEIAKKYSDHTLSFTGHSLGGWLADLSVAYCHTDFRYTNIKAVTFDAPGSYEMMKQLTKSQVEGSSSQFHKKQLDITAYISAPNIVNCANKHVGEVYRLFPQICVANFNIQNAFAKWLLDTFELNSMKDGLLAAATHDLKYILPYFDLKTGIPINYEKVISWPSIMFDNYGGSEESTLQKFVGFINNKFESLSNTFFDKFLLDNKIKKSDTAISNFWAKDKTTISSILCFMCSFFTGKINSSQFWWAQESLDINNGYKIKEETNLDSKFRLRYLAQYSVDPNVHQKKVKDEIDRTLVKILEEDKSFFSGCSEIFRKSINMINETSYLDEREFQIIIKQEYRNKIVVSHLRDVVRILDSKELYLFFRKNQTDSLIHHNFIVDYEDAVIERLNYTDQIAKKFESSKIVVASGEPGFGKSFVAHIYGLKLREVQKDYVIVEFNADSNEKLNSEFKRYAQSLDINSEKVDSEIIMHQVYAKIEQCSKRILFVFDNVEDFEDVKKYVENLPINAKLLITTRKFDMMPETNIAIPEFTESEAEEYLSKKIPFVPNNDRKKLISVSFFIPYHLCLIASYIKKNSTIDIDHYFKNLPNEKENLFYLTFEEVKNNMPESWKLMQYLPYLGSDFVPLRLLNKLGISNIQPLCEKSLLKVVQKWDDRGIKINKSVRAMIKNYCENEKENLLTEVYLISSLINVYHDLFPFLAHIKDEKWTSSQKYFENVKSLMTNINFAILSNDSDKKKLLDLYFRLGRYYDLIGVDYDKALSTYSKALEMSKRFYSPNDPNIAEILQNIGWVYKRLKNYEKCLTYLQLAHTIIESVYPKEDIEIFRSKRDIGILLVKTGEIKKGVSFQEQALMMRKDFNSSNTREKARTLCNLAKAYLLVGNFKNALSYQQEALKIRIEIFKNMNHPEMATSLNSIGLIYKTIDLSKSLYYVEQSLQMRRKIHKGNHQRIVQSLKNTAMVYLEIGDQLKALHFLLQAYKMSKVLKKNFGELEKLARQICSTYSLDFNKYIDENETKLITKISALDESEANIRVSLQKNTLNKIQSKAAEASWNKFGCDFLLRNKGIAYYLTDKWLISQLKCPQDDQKLELAKMMCFEAIALGIVYSKNKNTLIALKFAKNCQTVITRMIDNHVEYFIDLKLVETFQSQKVLSADQYKEVAKNILV